MTPELVQEASPQATLTQALLLWTIPTSRPEVSLAHATLNAVVDGVIQPNTESLSLAQLRALNVSLQGLADSKAGRQGIGVFPPNLLYSDPHQALTAWWRPGGATPQFFNCAELGQIQGVVPMPSLVFKQQGGHLAVCAVAGGGRPDASTLVCHAPLFNIHTDGSVCLGDVDIESIGDFCAMERNQAAFLRGVNTHPNGQHKKTHYPHGVFALWRDLIANPTQGWDDAWLVPMPNQMTLGQWLMKG